MEKYSIIIRNGTVVDPGNRAEKKMDIAVSGGMIVKTDIEIAGEAVSEIDASGCFVTPGLIDHHAHVYPMAKIGIPGEAVCFSSGVTTVVDAGSTGCKTYESYVPVLKSTRLEIKSYINVCSNGLDSLPERMEDVKPEHMDAEGIREIFRKYPEDVLGLKIRISRNVVREQGMEPLKAAVCLGKELGVPLMVHITDPPEALEAVFRTLRPGDIVTHMYQNTGDSILRNGALEAAREARARGVLFEAADARAHFSFETAEKAIKEGFLPDFLGTDLTKLSMYLRPTSFSMAMQISKYSYLGIPFSEVIKRCTVNTAKSMKIYDRVGSIEEGKQADIAVFRPHTGRNVFGDHPFYAPDCHTREGNLVYEPVLTIKNGEMVYRNITF